MIHQSKIVEELRNKWPQFAAYIAEGQFETNEYLNALGQLCNMTGSELTQALAKHATPGALPTLEFDKARNLVIDFPLQFNNHQEARQWAFETLLDTTTIAVDGSQIKPNADINIPIAAIQVAKFINHHTRNGSYVKDTTFKLLTPDQLFTDFNGEIQLSEQRVNTERFILETRTLCEEMKFIEESQSERFGLALFDSSFVISFADRLHEDMRDQHVNAVLALLRCSEHSSVPIAGYIDKSHARDLTNMLSICFGLKAAPRINDAQLLSKLSWGGRTPLFICARGSADKKRPGGVLDDFQEYKRGIGFFYLKTNSVMPPSRIEIPMWIYEKGLLDKVTNLILAETIVGNGYPYAIETADATAVLTQIDRDAFYSIFQSFAQEQGVTVRTASKALSKARRR